MCRWVAHQSGYLSDTFYNKTNMANAEQRSNRLTSVETRENVVVDRLCAAVEQEDSWRGGGVWFFGWDSQGKPVKVLGEENLSETAYYGYNAMNKRRARLSSRDRLSLADAEPVEVIGLGKPIDRRDPNVEDIFQVYVNDEDGNLTTLKVEEVDLLEAVLAGQVVFENFVDNTIFEGETIPAQYMYMSILPLIDGDLGQRKVYALMFPPAIQNESNESTYQLFLSQIIQSLLTLDKQQVVGEQRGYGQVIEKYLTSEVRGGDAYVILKGLRDSGLLNISDGNLRRAKVLSGKDTSLLGQLKVMAEQAGLVKLGSSTAASVGTRLEALSIKDSMVIIQECLRLVQRQVRG